MNGKNWVVYFCNYYVFFMDVFCKSRIIWSRRSIFLYFIEFGNFGYVFLSVWKIVG